MTDTRPSWLPEVDLRSVTRDSKLVNTRIDVVVKGYSWTWLQFGSLSRAEVNETYSWIGVHYNGVMDEEHDSAYAVRLEVRGLQLVGVYGGCTTLSAWIAATPEDSRSICAPRKALSLRCFPLCKECKGEDRHRVGKYTPEPDAELWNYLRGARIMVKTAPAWKETK